MVSLHIETARFKSPGHKNELCFFWDTLVCTVVQLVDQNFSKYGLEWLVQRCGIALVFITHVNSKYTGLNL